MKSDRRFETHSDEETIALGRELANILPAQGVVLLSGDLGAGKTTLTKGIVVGRGAGAVEDVVSPTFTLIHEYGDPVRVYHVDLYRLDKLEDVQRLGIDDLLDGDALVLIEWGERFPELWPKETPHINIRHGDGDIRIIELSDAANQDHLPSDHSTPRHQATE
jgi:tRNA threonylcarbamoyladenosine biosynthesis protein TsaE